VRGLTPLLLLSLRLMGALGFARLLVFFSVWTFSTFLPLLLVVRLVQGSAWPLCAFLLYWSFRRLLPAQAWPWLRSVFCLDHSPYWRTQRTVLDGFKDLPTESCLLAFHPHGMLCCGWTVCNASKQFAGVTWLVADILLLLPCISDFLRWNASEGVSAPSLRRLLARRRNVALLPGGFEEATLYRFGRHRVFLSARRGFIKYALCHGTQVFPAYTFGEERTFYAFHWLSRLRLKLNALRCPAVLFVGQPLLPWMPRSDVDLTTVIGPPLQLPRIEAPTAEEVALWHGRYVDALRALFDKHKAAYAFEGEKATLEVL